ncbi:3-hydroxyacyl-CoA dehydrogenase NAD-binding domain-containing protein [Rhodoferax sp.]|jgi:2-polyprenyl-6-methoxyphenol hydroxylase-like FAD-dependent oxidoreductase|uniref:3-hydroxyacyl-CoA dehydrogenase NAD-binding domain-containing protein n=1 Tax=Rhodoferax sp. TaxID=50421 RepID=UPI0037849C53
MNGTLTAAERLLGTAHVAIVGASLVGAGWAIVFARAGLTVRVYDASPAVRSSVLGYIAEEAAALDAHGLLDAPQPCCSVYTLHRRWAKPCRALPTSRSPCWSRQRSRPPC